ncbi:hypothetical protein I6E52_10160 [Salinibacterium sp. NG253]|uniref:hypothetical protein n=1 Tax=Salinibacterium sp. NG253 TaxID=2792039 RepID=UPI0018CF4E3C|nr:hypothetical protein [Salinibacterium sp. NG253]MBH0117208.1 hypothetical protein [Salinibacterium sp. NG253]
MTLIDNATRTPKKRKYIVGAGVMTVVAFSLAGPGVVFSPIAELALAIYLGPLGLVALFLGALRLPEVYGIYEWIAALFTLVMAVGIAFVNVEILARWRRPAPPLERPFEAEERRHGWRQQLAAVLFVAAGLAFIFLCFFAGGTAGTTAGIAVRESAERANHLIFLSAIVWVPGLVAAIAGLRLWIVNTRRGEPVLRWAIADLAIMLTLIGILWADVTQGAAP